MMNHGLINKNYYHDLTIYDKYPELTKLNRYFKAYTGKDKYYVAMKYHAVHLCKKICPDISLNGISNVVNLGGHDRAHYYLNKYIPIYGHKEFIDQHFNKFVEEGLYPIKSRSTEDIKKYGKFKPILLQKNKEHSQIKKKEVKKGRSSKYSYKTERNEKELY